MFERLGIWFEAFFAGYVADVVAATAGGLGAIALSLLTAYVALYGYAVMRGEVSEPLATFGWKMVKQVAIISIATAGGLYIAHVVPFATGLQDSMATVFVRGGVYSGSAPANAMAALDAVFQQGINAAQALWRDVSMFRLDLLVALVLVILGNTIFLVIATFVALLAKLIVTFTLAVGPIAILCLMFRPTARLFDSWLSLVLSAAVLSWIVFFALGLSLYVVDRVLVGVAASGAFTSAAPPGAPSALEASASYLVVFWLLAVLLYQAPSLASGLTGGSSVQMGAAMVSNAANTAATIVNAMRGGGARGAGGGAASGGSVSRGGGAAYATGRAVGAVGRGVRHAYQRAASTGGRP